MQDHALKMDGWVDFSVGRWQIKGPQPAGYHQVLSTDLVEGVSWPFTIAVYPDLVETNMGSGAIMQQC